MCTPIRRDTRSACWNPATNALVCHRRNTAHERVEQTAQRFDLDTDADITVDAVYPLDHNLAIVTQYLDRQAKRCNSR